MRRLQREGKAVCLVSPGGGAELAAADCGVGLCSRDGATPWSAHLLVGNDLTEVVFLRALQALDFAVRADTHDFVAADRDGFREVGGAIARVDLAVNHDQIHRAIVFALRANDETGDERYPDNECHGISREARRPR